MDDAFENRYGVAAFNVFNDLSLEAVVEAAAELSAPLIVQTSLKTVKAYGADLLAAMFHTLAERAPIPVSLHLDHCPEREWITTCLDAGWHSVLFDGSHLDVGENRRQTLEVVEEAQRRGAAVEGEIESIRGVEDDVGSDEETILSTEIAVDFIRATGVYCFAPAVGTAHGVYIEAPELRPQRVTELVEETGVPMVLHGGTGLSPEEYRDLISRGCAKVNISTALKISFIDACRGYLTREPDRHDPPALFACAKAELKETAKRHMELFGAADRASAILNTAGG